MPLEIELKFRVNGFADIEKKLSRGSDPREEVETDTYYAHPCREFKATGEVLRIRSKEDLEYVLCYKSGKKDGVVKAKRELEVDLHKDEAATLHTILSSLGFTESITVEKWRRSYFRTAAGFDVTVCLDDVKDLGEFVEVEIVCEEEDRVDAERVVHQVASKLGLTNPVTKGYAAMMHELKGKSRCSGFTMIAMSIRRLRHCLTQSYF